MAEIYERLAHIQKLANTLTQKLEAEHDSRLRAEAQVRDLTEELAAKSREYTLLERELEMAKVARGMASGGEDSTLAKAKINSLVREIDRCIAMLNE